MTTSNAVTVTLLLFSFSLALTSGHGRPVRFDLSYTGQLGGPAAGLDGPLDLPAASGTMPGVVSSLGTPIVSSGGSDAGSDSGSAADLGALGAAGGP